MRSPIQMDLAPKHCDKILVIPFPTTYIQQHAHHSQSTYQHVCGKKLENPEDTSADAGETCNCKTDLRIVPQTQEL